MPSSHHRCGLLVPPANAAVEPELRRLVGDRVNFYTGRFPALPGLELRDRLRRYNTVVGEELPRLGGLGLAGVVIACSGSRYLLGPSGDREDCDRLTQRFGMRVTSAALATLELLEAVGARAVTLVSPYVPWLTELSVGYWRLAGIEVRRTISVRAGGRFLPYQVTTEEAIGQIEAAGPCAEEVLLLTGTGMFSNDVIRHLQARRTFALSSNLCSAWWALRRAEVDLPEVDPWRQISGRLAEHRGQLTRQ